MAKILITGGAGFIGYFISRILSNNKANYVHIVDNLSKGEKDKEFLQLIEKSNVEFYEFDLEDANVYNELESEYDQIYHLAAIVGVKKVMKNPVLTLRVNTLSTIYLLDYIKKMNNKPKLIFASSCENYVGSIKHCDVKIPTPENVPLCIEDIYNPRWTYAGSKILGEIACIQYSKQYNFVTTIVRYHNIFGPRMGTNHVIPEFVLRLIKDPSNLEMYGGYQFRSFCYVKDAAEMTIKLMNNEKTNDLVINVGSDHYIQITELVGLLFNIIGVSPKIIEKGAPKGSVNKRKPDLNLIKDLGCYTSEMSFIDGLKKTYEWYYNNYKVE